MYVVCAQFTEHRRIGKAHPGGPSYFPAPNSRCQHSGQNTNSVAKDGPCSPPAFGTFVRLVSGETRSKDERQSCPFCGESIMASATKCDYCGEWLEEPQGAEEITVAAVVDTPPAEMTAQVEVAEQDEPAPLPRSLRER